MKKSILLLTSLTFVLVPLLTFAEDKTPAQPDTKSAISHHEAMATAHQKAADCLKSGKPMNDCREQFMKARDAAPGPGSCPCKDKKDCKCKEGKCKEGKCPHHPGGPKHDKPGHHGPHGGSTGEPKDKGAE